MVHHKKAVELIDMLNQVLTVIIAGPTILYRLISILQNNSFSDNDVLL